MKLPFRTYTAYSIGCAVVWAVILAVVAAEGQQKNPARPHLYLPWMGARVVLGHHRQGRLSAAQVGAADGRSALRAGTCRRADSPVGVNGPPPQCLIETSGRRCG